ncbi:hypothetical protein ARSEF4850_009026 [Beauveria asiatica]
MPVREQIRVETKSFAPGVLPLSARTFRFVACLRIVTGDDVALRFVCLITAAFYNDDGQPVWSRRVLIYKIDPGNHHTSATSQDLVEYQRFPESQQSRVQDDDDATSSTSNDSQLISHLTQEEYHQQLSHRCEDRTPVAQYNLQHRPVGYQYQGHAHHQIHTNHHTSPHPQAYLTPDCAIHSLDTLIPNQHLASTNRPSSTGHWYTSFNPQERRWVNTWQPN